MNITKYAIIGALLAVPAATFTACNDDYEDVAPGNYIETERIETFPGDTVRVVGTASNGSKIESVALVCEAWGINQVYDRSSMDDNVFNYEYKLVVPEDATFNQTLTVIVKSDNGKSTVREIPVTFLPDTQAPTFTPVLTAQVGLDFSTTDNKAEWNLTFTAADDRKLVSAVIDIPGIGYNKTVTLYGRNQEVNELITFDTIGVYPATITLEDASGNRAVSNVEVMVMLAEVENPYNDYPGMYIVNALENPDDYIDGYYQWMDRQGEYQYQGKFYAPTDNSKFYVVPERTMDGDLFGASPYVSSKLMNNNGYVVPVTVEKAGYYGVWIDLAAHSFSMWPLDAPADLYTGPLYVSGTGFTIGDWAMPATTMTLTGNRYTCEMELVAGYTGDFQYYFTNSDWTRVFRADNEGKWWFESASGACVIYHTDYSGPVTVTFDAYMPWGTIKKKQ